MKLRAMAVGRHAGLRKVVRATAKGETVALVEGGVCRAIVVPAGDATEWRETAACLADSRLLARLARAEAETARGEVRDLDAVLPRRPRRRQ